MKRIIDTAIAILLLPVLVLLCLPAALAIRLESKGNPLFVQTRVGKNQSPFRLFKLRTMSKDTKQVASHEVAATQITKVGMFLRRTKIDELPQVINVLFGQMSFVGPRPCLPSQHELIAERAKRGVFSVLPGITGPAQLAGIDMSTPRKLARADTANIATWTISRYLTLIVQTAAGGGRGDAVKSE